MADTSRERSRPTTDPLDRDVPPGSVPLRSPMPRSRALDQEEPELNTGEADVPPESDAPKPGGRDRAGR
jgi:hypothetical protein